MDSNFNDISVAFYVSETDNGTVGTVHSYSSKDGTPARLAEIAGHLATIGGMEQPTDAPQVRFACGEWHGAAAKRLFVEAVKLKPGEDGSPRPLELPDSRTEQTIKVESRGEGVYEIVAENVAEGERSRAGAIGKAIAKLAQLDFDEERNLVTFPCKSNHDALLGLLLVRAQNLRQVLREEEMQAGRGVLSAPGSNEEQA